MQKILKLRACNPPSKILKNWIGNANSRKWLPIIIGKKIVILRADAYIHFAARKYAPAKIEIHYM